MGVMCSLLGHDYDDTDVERERTERGDEIVLTAKRIERCQNCGHERTISENTEVTTLSAAAGVIRDPDGTVVIRRDEPDDVGSPTVDRDVVIGDDESDEQPDETVDIKAEHAVVETHPTSDTWEERRDEVGDIDRIGVNRMSHESRTRNRPARAPGEWPDEHDESARATTVEADRAETDGLGVSGSLVNEAREHTDWPGEADGSLDSRGLTNGTENGDASVGVTRVAAGDSFACASCGFSATVADSPLRAGDICPGCQRGYLAWGTRKG